MKPARTLLGVLGRWHIHRGIAIAGATVVAAAIVGAGAPAASAVDEFPCGKEVLFPELGTTMQPCPLGGAMSGDRIPVYDEPVPSPAGQALPTADGFIVGTTGKYFECDRAFPRAVYYHPQGWRNLWWARTISDDTKRWGWVPEVFFAGGANDEPDFGLRNCPPPPPPPPPPSPCESVDGENGATLSARLTRGRRAITTSYGNRVRVRGQLEDANGGPVPGASLCVAERDARGGDDREVTDSVVTDENGRFRYRVERGPSRRVSFVYRSGAATASAAVRVRVRAPVSLKAKPRKLRTGETVSFHGTVGGGERRAGTLVEMQVRRGNDWEALLGTTRTRKHGRFRDRYRFRFSEGVQHYAFRAHVPAQRGYPFAAGSSKRVRVRVEG